MLFTVLAIALLTKQTALAKTLLIEDVSIVSPETLETSKHKNVLIVDGIIKEVSSKRRTADLIINGKGQYLIPVLIDSHVHLGGIPGMLPKQTKKNSVITKQALAQIPKSYLFFGFTSVIDLMSNQSATDKWNAQTLRPDAHFCIGAPIANGYPLAWIPKEQRFSGNHIHYMLYDSRQKAEIPKHIKPSNHTPSAIINKIKSSKAICVKTFYETGFGDLRGLPNPSLTMMHELVEQAHQQGLPVLMHGNSQAAHNFAMEAGIDILAHGMWHWEDPKAQKISDDISMLLKNISRKQIGYQPTIQVIYGEQELFNDAFFDSIFVQHAIPRTLINWYQSEEGKWMRAKIAKNFGKKNIGYQAVKEKYAKPIFRLQSAVKHLASNKAKILFGSDSPSGPFYTQFHGLNGKLEIERLAEAGVTLNQLFRALTIDNARAFGLDQKVGTVQAGKVANLLLLSKNPLVDIEAYNSIKTVFLHGKAVDRKSLSATVQ